MRSQSKIGHLSNLSYRQSDIDILQPDPPFWTKTSWLQLGYGIWVNLTLMNIGLCLEFSAVAIPQLKLEAEIPMTKSEEATIASILTLSSPIGCIIAGILLDRCGRKSGLIWCHVPIVIGWFYVALASHASSIIIGRVITGVGVGMAMAAPRAYITEITLPNMRGVIGALPNLAISLGLTIQAVLGMFLGWRLLCYICGGYATILLCANKFLPDTPYYILMRSTVSEARVTLRRFRSSKFNLEAELQTLEEFKAVNNIRRLTFNETRKALCKSSSCKPFGIILCYITLMQFSGVNVITTWAVEILQMARSSFDPHTGNVILATTRIVFGIATSFLLFRVGRRPLALVSAAGVGAMGISLGAYLHSHDGGRSPLIMLVTFVGFAVPGYHTLPMMMMFELFPLQVRGILSGVVFSSANLLMTLVVHIYPTMRDNIGMANTFLTYGAISLLGTIVLYFILPETKELTLQEIEEYFNHRRSTLVSERRLLSIQMRSQMLSAKDLGNEQPPKDKNKKKKRLRIASSDDVSIYKTEARDSAVAKKASDMSFDDIIIVYDEDNIAGQDKIDSNDLDNNDNADKSKKADMDGETKQENNEVDKMEHDKTEKENKDKTEPEEGKRNIDDKETDEKKIIVYEENNIAGQDKKDSKDLDNNDNADQSIKSDVDGETKQENNEEDKTEKENKDKTKPEEEKRNLDNKENDIHENTDPDEANKPGSSGL